MDDIDRIIKEEYEKYKKGRSKPFHVTAQSLNMPLLDYYKRTRKLYPAFPLQIEEKNFILENRNTIPKSKLKEMFNLTDSQINRLLRGNIFDEHGIDFMINSTKWLLEKELKWNLDDELPHKLNLNIFRKNKLSCSEDTAYQIQKDNPEFYPFPAIFIMVDNAYPNIYKPWQFRKVKTEYWKDKELGKIRLADALRWFVEEKQKIPRENIPYLKDLRNFINAKDLGYYHLQEAFRFQFDSQKKWIEYTYPENKGKINREHTIALREKLKNVNRTFNACEICGFKDKTEIHHIIPIDSGGANDIDNLICLCSNHHAQAGKSNIHNKILYSHIKKGDRTNYFINLFKKEIMEVTSDNNSVKN